MISLNAKIIYALIRLTFATIKLNVRMEVTKIPRCVKYEIFHSDGNYMLYNCKISYVMLSCRHKTINCRDFSIKR